MTLCDRSKSQLSSQRVPQIPCVHERISGLYSGVTRARPGVQGLGVSPLVIPHGASTARLGPPAGGRNAGAEGAPLSESSPEGRTPAHQITPL
jgi:hypothetical protein